MAVGHRVCAPSSQQQTEASTWGRLRSPRSWGGGEDSTERALRATHGAAKPWQGWFTVGGTSPLIPRNTHKGVARGGESQGGRRGAHENPQDHGQERGGERGQTAWEAWQGPEGHRLPGCWTVGPQSGATPPGGHQPQVALGQCGPTLDGPQVSDAHGVSNAQDTKRTFIMNRLLL